MHLLAGGTPTEDVLISANEQVVYDGSVLTRSEGSTSVVLTAGGQSSFRSRTAGSPSTSGVLAQVPKYDSGVLGRAKRQVLGIRAPAPEPSTYDANADIKEMQGEGEYTLVKIFCRPLPRTRRAVVENVKGLVSDTLRATVNTSEHIYTQYIVNQCI